MLIAVVSYYTIVKAYYIELSIMSIREIDLFLEPKKVKVNLYLRKWFRSNLLLSVKSIQEKPSAGIELEHFQCELRREKPSFNAPAHGYNHTVAGHVRHAGEAIVLTVRTIGLWTKGLPQQVSPLQSAGS